MKTIYKLSTLVVFLLICGMMQAQLLSYDFENLNVGDQVAATIGDPWTTWSGTPGTDEDAVISDEQSIDNRSLKIDTGNDVVLKLGDKTSGAYKVSLDMYIPDNKIGYFNILHSFENTNSVWALQVWLNSDKDGGGSYLYAGEEYYQFDYVPYNTWNHIEVDIHLDDSLAVLKINSEFIFDWNYSQFYSTAKHYGIAAMNMCAISYNPDANGFYVDNISLEEIIDSAEEIDRKIYSLYPNPASDIIHIDGDDLNYAAVYNSNGQMVSIIQIHNNAIKINDLKDGVYYLNIFNKKGESAIQKVVVTR